MRKKEIDPINDSGLDVTLCYTTSTCVSPVCSEFLFPVLLVFINRDALGAYVPAKNYRLHSRARQIR
jgi:hypothetical protein